MNYQDKTKEELIQELQSLQHQHISLKASYEKEMTGFKETEKKLIESRDLFTNLACLVPGVIYQFRLFPDGHYSFPYSSPGMNEIYEVTPEEVKEDVTPILERFHPDDFERLKETIAESARTLDIFYFEFRVILPIQGLRWRWCQAYPERMSDGGTLWHGIVLDITERKLAEEKLQNMVDELQSSQRIAQMGNWKLDLRNGTYTASDELYRIFGFRIGSHLKIKQVSDCIHPDDLERVTRRRGELIQSKESYTIEFRIITKDTGEVKHLKSIGEIRCDDNSNAIAIVGTIQDITEYKKTEQILNETNALIEHKQREKESIINSTNDLVWSLDKDLRIITANDLFLNSTLNYSGKTMSHGDYILNPEFYSPELIAFWKSLYEEVLTGKTIRKEFHTIPLHGSSETSYGVNLTPIFLGSKVIGITCFCNNFTRQVKTEKQLKLLSKAIEHTPVSVVITDKKGNIEYINPKFAELTGYSIDEVKGKNPRVLQSGKHPISFYKELWETIISGKEWKGEFHNRKKNGELYIESAIISPILNNHHEVTHFVAVKEDITGKKKMHEDLIKAKEKAEENDLLKTSFLNNISHEIRTPFNGMLGYLSMLQNNELPQDEKEDYIGIINNSAYRLMNTINDIVEISEIQSGQLKLELREVDIRNVVREQFSHFKSLAERKGITYRFKDDLPNDINLVSTDEFKVKKIVYNLIDNALKFTTFGSVDIRLSKNDQFIIFAVSDTGIGIPEQKKPTIFDLFMQVDTSKTREFEGLGLGLSISKAYVEIMGGEISVDSEIGKGSTFVFNIPFRSVIKEKNDVFDIITQKRLEHKPEKLKILIAEDDDTSLELLHYNVRSIAKEILIVRNGAEVIEACRKNADIDLILMDIKMPVTDGHEATRQIRRFNSKVVIIAQTAFAFNGDREEAIAAGCNDYISKPLHKNTLLELIKKHF